MPDPMLNVNKIDVFYGKLQALWEITFDIQEGELVVIIGANGAGKSTIVNTISGFLHPRSGSIELYGKRVDQLNPHQIVEMGIIQIPEGKALFPRMTVEDNLLLGSYLPHARKSSKTTMDRVFNMFPILKERKNQLAGTLSGGEQQMLATGRGLMSQPKLLLLDEPSLGLAPMLVTQMFNTIKQLHDEGITILLIEQNVKRALTMADRAYVIENGRVVMKGKSEELLNSQNLKKAFMGL